MTLIKLLSHSGSISVYGSCAGAVLEAVGNDLTPIFLIELVTCISGSAVLLFCVIFPDGEDSSKRQRSFAADVVEPFSVILRQPALMALLGFMTTCNVINGMVRILFTPLIMAFGTTGTLAAVLTLSGFGAIVGAVLLNRVGAAITRPIRAMLLCSALQGLLLGLVGTRPSATLILSVAFGYAAVETFSLV